MEDPYDKYGAVGSVGIAPARPTLAGMKRIMTKLSYARGNRGHRRAFTLLEILIVIVVTAVLFGLLLRPLVSSLSLTQEAQTLAASQDAGRKATEILTRELGHASYVLDGMSHPFSVSSATNANIAASTSAFDTYTNFLDIDVPDVAGARQIAHIYGAKLDFVMAQPSMSGSFTDPTTGDVNGINLVAPAAGNGPALQESAPALLPLAQNQSIIRYFVGLEHPGDVNAPGHYSNSHIGLTYASPGPNSNISDDNTYVLYRAEVPLNFPGGGGIDTDYWNTTTNPSGALVPEFDDPDFFRYVTTSDINWLTAAHSTYTAGEAVVHNNMVDQWVLAAKPVISGPQIDLLSVPTNPDGSFDSTYGGVAVLDPVTGNSSVVASVTVSFTPTVHSNDSLAPTQTSNPAAGLASTPPIPTISVAKPFMTYIPSSYDGTYKSWATNFSVQLYPADYGSAAALSNFYFYTQQTFFQQAAPTTPVGVYAGDNPGDIIEYCHDPAAAIVDLPVYNVTQGLPEPNATPTATAPISHRYVPFGVDRDKGNLDFSVRPIALINAANPPYPYFNYANITTLDLSLADVNANDPELPQYSLTTGLPSPLTNIEVENAHVVSGSLRVLAPDILQGASYQSDISYQVVANAPLAGSDQCGIDYADNSVSFPAGVAAVVPPPYTKVAYDFQSNMTVVLEINGAFTTFAYLPYTVNATYESRDTVSTNIGVRIYRPGSVQSDFVNLPSTIAVGNANH